MLSFLRTHQKAILASTGALVIFSMCFFGMSQKSQMGDEKKSTILGKAIDGSSTHQEDISAMSIFFSQLSDPRIAVLSPEEDVFMKEVLSSGLAVMLIQNYWPLLEQDFLTRLETYRHFRPYAHPEMHFINAENIWMRFAPDLYGALEKFKEEPDPKTQVKYLVEAIIKQSEFPEHILRQLLFFQERQFNTQVRDPYIQMGNLSLFNARSLYEVFGPKFMELATEFIYNAAMIAKANGLKVSKEEAQSSLMCLASQGHKKEKEMKPKEAKVYYTEMLKKLQISERKAVEYWQKLLLFRRLFDEVNSSVYLDSLVYDSIGEFSHEELKLKLYAMPKLLCMDSFEKMMKLEVYLDHVAKRPHGKLLDLPSQYLSADRVKSRYPKLVGKRFELDIAKVSLHEIGLEISLKDLMQYEIDHFHELLETMPELALKNVGTEKEKVAALQSLEPSLKKKLDVVARTKILAEHPELIEAAFMQAKHEKKNLLLNLDDANCLFSQCADNNTLIEKFEKAFVESEKIEESKSIELKSNDDDAVYRVQVLSISPDYEVLTFKDADEASVLDKLLTDRLEREYASIRSLHPSEFKNESGAFLPLDEVKDQVGKYVFQDIICELQNYLKDTSSQPQVVLSNLDEVAKYRLAEFMQSALVALQSEENNNVEAFVKKGGAKDHHLEDQFKLAFYEETLSRAKPSPLMDEQMFRMKEKEWSPVSLLSGYGLGFYKLEHKRIDEEEKKKAMDKGYAILIADAKKAVLFDLLEQMQVQGVLHVQKEERSEM